mmetsp:Transcript_13064/g.48506  ORF Transcript_13064/g.48506 Transcript_13064/m.48506 type:complete len:229 (-) Transcript_13064:2958-3644(-)
MPEPTNLRRRMISISPKALHTLTQAGSRGRKDASSKAKKHPGTIPLIPRSTITFTISASGTKSLRTPGKPMRAASLFASRTSVERKLRAILVYPLRAAFWAEGAPCNARACRTLLSMVWSTYSRFRADTKISEMPWPRTWTNTVMSMLATSPRCAATCGASRPLESIPSECGHSSYTRVTKGTSSLSNNSKPLLQSTAAAESSAAATSLAPLLAAFVSSMTPDTSMAT